MDILYLVHRIDPYGIHPNYYYAIDEDNTHYTLTIQELIDFKGSIITHDKNPLLNELRKKYDGYLPIIIDVSQIKKLLIGKPRRIFYNKPPWHFWNMLNKDLGTELAIQYYKKLRVSNNDQEIYEILKHVVNRIKSIYGDLLKQLVESGQFKRFFELENEMQQHLNKRQIEGIKLDLPVFQSKINELRKQKDIHIYQLREKYNVTNLNPRSIRATLVKLGYPISEKEVEHFNLLGYLKAASITSDLCKDIYAALRIQYDHDQLNQYIHENECIYPEFEGIGTVTSRTIITYPHIQHLKRENRIIFKPKDNYSLVYCDFNQFEPGILASASKDQVMLDVYNSGDIYRQFSKFIFGSEDHRKEAKILFLSYLYGMSDKKLIKIIDQIIKDKGLNEQASATDFFNQFAVLKKYKDDQSQIAIKNGFIMEPFCLRRNLAVHKQKTKKGEERYVLSQIIQGTASYILKTAILKCMEDPDIEFLVPMHDAALFQVPSDKLKEKSAIIESHFIEQYKTICPDINARVDFKHFHE